MTELFNRAFNERILPPKFSDVEVIEYREFPDFEYQDIVFLQDKKIPRFALSIFEDPFITHEEKKKFIRDFLKPYLSNKNFKNNVKDKYLVFIKNIYQGVNTMENILNMGTINGFPKVIKIGTLPVVNQSIIISNSERTETKIVRGGSSKNFTTSNTYKVRSAITHLPDIKANNFIPILDKEIIWDTGAEISSLFIQDDWDYNNDNFFETNNVLLELNKCGSHVEKITMNCAGGILIEVNAIIFRSPIYISIEGGNKKSKLIYLVYFCRL